MYYLLWSTPLELDSLYFIYPQFRRLHWGLFTGYTYGVVCGFIVDYNSYETNSPKPLPIFISDFIYV
jgi:hypothetical protein